MEKGSRLRSRKRSLSGKAARKIASCAKCSKRFITFSGSHVCVDCRQTNNNNKADDDGPVSLAVLPKSAGEEVKDTTVRNSGDECPKCPKDGASGSSASSSIAKENVGNGRRAENRLPSAPSSESTGTGSGSANDGKNGIIGSSNATDLGLEQQQQHVPLCNDNEMCGRSEDADKDNCDDDLTGVNDDDSNAGDNDDEDGHSSEDADKKTDHVGDMNAYDEEVDQSDIDRKSQHASSKLFFATSSRGTDDASYRCFICNADLSTVQGLKGRMNHIKRCGKKHGIQAGDGAKGLRGDQMGGSLIEDGQCTERVNIDRQGWHDDQDAGMAIDDVAVSTEPDQEPTNLAAIRDHDEMEAGVRSKDEDVPTMPQQKQSSLNSFFTRPIRSLDKVLLQGARNVAKKEQIASKRRQLPASNAKSNGGGRGGGSWKRRKREAPTSSPAYKRISNTTVLVDAFHYANPALPQTHFLSHFHSDHYGGITKHWNAGVIYCSLPTAALVHSQLGVPKKYLHPLPMHTKTVVDANGRPISVTLLDANHCPGAVMFLFELSNGKQILHVGDFRWDRDAMLGQPQLRQFWKEGSNNGMRLDEIYLDTTYCNEKYATMPSQKQAIAAAVSTARDEIEGSPAKSSSLLPKGTPRRNSTLLLFGSYTIGKEKIFMSCAKSLKMKIYVEPRKLRILSALNLSREQMEIFTTTKSEAQIWVVPMGHCSFQHMDAYLADANSSTKGLGGGYSRVVAFRPTGWTHGGGGKKAKGLITTRRSGNKTIHGVPYSEHSSFSELVDCLLCLKPKRIIPTVSVSNSQEQVERLLRAANEKEMGGH